MKLRPYQSRLVSAVLTDVAAGTPEIVLAAAPGAGKTEMAFAIIRRALAGRLASRVLVLAHGTTVLRRQFAERAVAELGAEMVYEHVPGKNTRTSRIATAALMTTKARVIVALPQSLNRRAKLPPCDLVIVDEAHEFYEAAMAKAVIGRAGPRSAVLLTGTPSRFIARGLRLHSIALHDVMRECPEAVCDPEIDLVSSEFLVSYERYNPAGEIQKTFRFARKQTAATLDGLLVKLVQHLPRRRGRDVSGWGEAISAMGKTIIACRSLALARQVAGYFLARDVNVGLSTHENDLGSEEIERFKNDAGMSLLIVVRRGILGFNFPELMNLVDMTGTINIDRIFQMFARVVRPHPTKPKVRKLFVKMTPKGRMEGYTRDVTSAALQLGRRETFESFNGGNMDGIVVPRWRGDEEEGEARETRDEWKGQRHLRKPRRLADCFTAADFFEIVDSIDAEFSLYARTTLGKSRERLLAKSAGWGGLLCRFQGCGRQARVKALCHGHYAQTARGERLRPLRQRGVAKGAQCEFPDCGRSVYANSLCSGHSAQARRGENLRRLRSISPKGERPACSFRGCGWTSKARGLCASHDFQRRKHGRLWPVTRLIA